MKARQLSNKIKWAAVLLAAALHPILLSSLFPIVGERCNLVIVLAPFLAVWFFSVKLSILFLSLNALVTWVVFALVGNEGLISGLTKDAIVFIIVTGLCFALDRFRRYFEKGKALELELERLREPISRDDSESLTGTR
jgi:hypothetical protein